MGKLMGNPRNEIEQAFLTLLQPLLDQGDLNTAKAIGAQDYGTVLSAVLGAPPFAMIKYVGKSGELQPGGLTHYTAEISVLIATFSYDTLDAQRADIHDLLEKIEMAISGSRLTEQGVYWPAVCVAEQWSEMAGSGLEVWEQQYVVQWEERHGP